MTMPKLSIVVIARNEEKEIGRCLASAVHAASKRDAEVLFVDSDSTDRTVEVAAGYPVGIIRLKNNGVLSPAAGRWLGTQHTQGDFVFFVDGDMTIIDGWVEKALEVLSDPAIGGVSGRLFWVYPGEEPGYSRGDSLPLGVVGGLGGAAVYRRQALEKCGTFNPFVRGEEERELAYRLAQGGFSVVRVDVPMAFHFAKKPSMEENAGRSVYFAGVGQMMRRYFFQRPFWDLCMEHHRVYTIWLLGLALPVLLLVAWFAGAGGWAIAVAAFYIGGSALMVLRKGLKGAWLYLHNHGLLLVHFLRGLWWGVPPDALYPAGFVWVKREGMQLTLPRDTTIQEG